MKLTMLILIALKLEITLCYLKKSALVCCKVSRNEFNYVLAASHYGFKLLTDEAEAVTLSLKSFSSILSTDNTPRNYSSLKLILFFAVANAARIGTKASAAYFSASYYFSALL